MILRDVINFSLVEGWGALFLFVAVYWGIWWPLDRYILHRGRP